MAEKEKSRRPLNAAGVTRRGGTAMKRVGAGATTSADASSSHSNRTYSHSTPPAPLVSPETLWEITKGLGHLHNTVAARVNSVGIDLEKLREGGEGDEHVSLCGIAGLL